MTTTIIRNIPVSFPFKPYDLQVRYMEGVIDCLQNGQNGVLESPTGTGKTLCLLCASLAWLEMKKAQIQAQNRMKIDDEDNDYLKRLQNELNLVAGQSQSSRSFIGIPTIIYSSRTHTQLAQAMQELKRSAYSHMKGTVIGSREQLCIHEDIIAEQNNGMKVQLCRLKVKTRSCNYYNRVERMKNDPNVIDKSIVDIEDLVKLGQCHKFCPYYMAKELKQRADIVFMPYNYLLDPKTRKALGVELANNVIILDEAHNIERVCEESASFQIKSSDITLCIEEITTVMASLTDSDDMFTNDAPKDFDADDLCMMKKMFLDFESNFDDIPLPESNPTEGITRDGNYIFELLTKSGIRDDNYSAVSVIIDSLIQFLPTLNEGPFQRRGNGLQLFSDLLTVVFSSTTDKYRTKIQKCYKVHVNEEEIRNRGRNDWLSKATASKTNKVLNYWCFSPGFGMNMLLDQNVHCVILTSGTLAPLKPLISELELPVGVRLENPHIVKGDQVIVKVLTKGPDSVPLLCNYANRDNPKFLSSLSSCILNLTRIIPGGILIFFPSYPIMLKCSQHWQATGAWANIIQHKAIYVEPRDKISFNNAMTDYYKRIGDSDHKGAIFMGVCRGKVSEGLDFANINGRAVIVIGLPYPPLKDPRVILKKRYLDGCNAKDKEYATGDEWYSLEATRAVNQAIGRVIRHRYDYGAIILLDSRFAVGRVRSKLSLWLQQHVKVVENFGEMIRDVRGFFKNALIKFPDGGKACAIKPAETDSLETYVENEVIETISLSSSNSEGEVIINTRNFKDENPAKRKKLVVVSGRKSEDIADSKSCLKEFILMVQRILDDNVFKRFVQVFNNYSTNDDFAAFKHSLDEIFIPRYDARFIIPALEPYVKSHHKNEFSKYCLKMK